LNALTPNSPPDITLTPHNRQESEPMMGLGVAFKAFWRALTDSGFADQVARLLGGQPAATPLAAAAPAPVIPPVARPPARSEALTLLALLQREGRLIDFLQEPIAGYNDAQIGAAVRDIHRDCAAALGRVFALKPLLELADGSPVEVPYGFDAAKYHLTGNVAGQPPYRGTLRHPGWQATQVKLPEWNGSTAAANVVAPIEVEL
jgi:hypothetical protein